FLMKLNHLEEAKTSMMDALEYARESGEKEAELYRTLEAALLNALEGNLEKACKLLGASEAYSESSGYPLVGTVEVQRDELCEIIPVDQGEGKKWYEEGRKMKIEKAIVYAMAEN
ncbi:MAG: hypothetical protein ACSLE0_18215, partial [Chitinophagaceae bacterium]